MPWSTSGRETEPAREEYPHIFSTDVWDRRSFWYTNRPNILNMQVRANWDAMKVINTDRPDFTDVATVVGKKVVQVETGWTFRERQQPDLISDQNTLPESLLRVGVSDHFEWRIKWDGGYTWSRTHDYDTGLTSSTAGGSDTTLGFKWIVKDQDDWMPLQTIVTRLSVPTGVPAYSANTVQPGISYIYNWQVRRWWFIRGATGLDWLNHAGPIFTTAGGPSSNIEFGHDYQVQCAQSISSYFQIAPRLGMFMEWFILMHAKSADNRPDNYHDYGVYYYLTPNLQLDARIGQRFSGPGFNEWFTGAGISFRLQE
ncbi:MAG TPA: transporter [Pirellulales bacterium]|nr:transporter [Pirellulales bacterium]